MTRDPSALVGLAIVIFMAGSALLAPLLVAHSPTAITGEPFEALSREHPLGTDEIGRDELSRVLYGARTSLSAAAITSILVMVVGVAAGLIAGWFGGWLDAVMMRVVDAVLGFPNLLLVIAIAALLDPSLSTVLLSLVLVWWVRYARIIRGMVRSLKARPFVEASRAMGAGATRIATRTVLPNALPSVIVLLSLDLGRIILAVSGLSFLGLGAQPPTPEWGAMLNDGRNFLLSDPRLILVPGIAISLTVLGFNLLGDGARDALDPRRELDP